MTRALRFTPGIAVPAVVVILACVNVIDVKVPHASLVLGPVCAAGLIALARLAGLDWPGPGLGKGTWRRGATWAAIEIAAVAVVFAVGAALPRTRDAFHDSRYHLSWPHALLTAFVLIPAGTVLLEEVAFRGVLWGLLREARGTAVATIGSSVLFGLWHVLPSLSLATDNSAVGATVGTAPGPEPRRPQPLPRTRRYLASFSLAGLAGGLIFYCLSLTPSLLPRVWYLQAVMSGVTVAIGYAVGVFAGWLVKSLIPWRGGPRARRAAWLVLAVAASVLIPLFGVLGAHWRASFETGEEPRWRAGVRSRSVRAR